MKIALYSTGRDKIRWIFSPVCLIVALVLIGGCAGSGNYGRLQRSREVDQIFRDYRVLPDHKYYYTQTRQNYRKYFIKRR